MHTRPVRYLLLCGAGFVLLTCSPIFISHATVTAPYNLHLVGNKAHISSHAPAELKGVIRAANRIVNTRYRYGGGHHSFNRMKSYDCSGAVSYALHGGDFVDWPYASYGYFHWGRAGKGRFITVYTNKGHMYMTVGNLRFDTSRVDDPGGHSGPRWRQLRESNKGFKVRHPSGF